MKPPLKGNTGKRLVLWAAVSAGLFSALALAQYYYLKDRLQKTMIRELSEWADMVAVDLKFTPRFDAKRYEQSSPPAPNYIVLTRSGLILDIEGFIPGIFGHVTCPTVIPDQPKTVVSPVGESYRILAKRLNGGTVYVGIASPEEFSRVDDMLSQAAAKFGDSLNSAMQIRNSRLGELVEYVIVDSDSRLRGALGGVPLSIDEKNVAVLTRSHSFTSDHGNPYFLYSQPVYDTTGSTAAFISIPQDERLERALLHKVLRFNMKTADIAWIIALGLFGAHLIASRNEWREETLSLLEATHLDKRQIFVRDGNSTRVLEGPALTNWIQQRLN